MTVAESKMVWNLVDFGYLGDTVWCFGVCRRYAEMLDLVRCSGDYRSAWSGPFQGCTKVSCEAIIGVKSSRINVSLCIAIGAGGFESTLGPRVGVSYSTNARWRVPFWTVSGVVIVVLQWPHLG